MEIIDAISGYVDRVTDYDQVSFVSICDCFCEDDSEVFCIRRDCIISFGLSDGCLSLDIRNCRGISTFLNSFFSKGIRKRCRVDVSISNRDMGMFKISSVVVPDRFRIGPSSTRIKFVIIESEFSEYGESHDE